MVLGSLVGKTVYVVSDFFNRFDSMYEQPEDAKKRADAIGGTYEISVIRGFEK